MVFFFIYALTPAATSNVPLCGNGIIDKGEDCDGGGMGLSGLDPCCSKHCHFIGNATCSATNFECCKNCRIAPATTPCRGESKELCQQAAVCTGFSLDCPQSEPLRDTTPCIDEGRCFGGKCLDYCAFVGELRNQQLKPCRCEDIATSCVRCCKSSDEVCKPLNISSGRDSFVQDGRPCNYGYCEGGKCQKTTVDMIQRLFDFIERLDSSTFVAFMRSNIVGTVIVFSLVIWIPLSWTISCIDKRNAKKLKEQQLNDETHLKQLQESSVLDKALKDYDVRTSRFRYTQKLQNDGLPVFESTHSEPPQANFEKSYRIYKPLSHIAETNV